MKRYILLSVAALSVVAVSCHKDKDENPVTAVTYPNYSNLKVGNYWVYETFKVDTDGNETSQNLFDSCYVESDTTVNGNQYFNVVSPVAVWGSASYGSWRDSLHYIVSVNGTRLFSSEDFVNSLRKRAVLNGSDTLYAVDYRMKDKDSTITTPAGTFTTLNYNASFHLSPNLSAWGEYRNRETRYARDIGIVEENVGFYMSLPDHFTRKLVRYHVN